MITDKDDFATLDPYRTYAVKNDGKFWNAQGLKTFTPDIEMQQAMNLACLWQLGERAFERLKHLDSAKKFTAAKRKYFSYTAKEQRRYLESFLAHVPDYTLISSPQKYERTEEYLTELKRGINGNSATMTEALLREHMLLHSYAVPYNVTAWRICLSFACLQEIQTALMKIGAGDSNLIVNAIFATQLLGRSAVIASNALMIPAVRNVDARKRVSARYSKNESFKIFAIDFYKSHAKQWKETKLRRFHTVEAVNKKFSKDFTDTTVARWIRADKVS